jgi:predicted transcriptional regulator
MASEEQQTQPPTGQELRPGMVTRIFDRVRQIKRAHPELSRRVDTLEAEIRDRLMSIKDAIDDFPRMERELITVLVINGIHKMCDEILIDDLEDDGQDGE